jgi:hypothetical protein
MQTFLPYPDFERCAATLDFRRLGKQRVEAKQILNALAGQNGWSHHPAVKMWIGYEPALHVYKDCMIREWIKRGYKNNMPLTSEMFIGVELPPWLGDERVHSSHRARLLHKDPEWYGQFGWTEEPVAQGYFWPSSATAAKKLSGESPRMNLIPS